MRGAQYSCGCVSLPFPDHLDNILMRQIRYSPIGRGMLSGEYTKRSQIPEGDIRLRLPRFSEENFGKNLDLVNEVKKIASTLR